jgi:hypothetical protein
MTNRNKLSYTVEDENGIISECPEHYETLAAARSAMSSVWGELTVDEWEEVRDEDWTNTGRSEKYIDGGLVGDPIDA